MKFNKGQSPGLRLKLLRVNKGLLQREVAEKAGTGIRRYNDWERDMRKPRVKYMKAIAGFYGLDVTDIWPEG